MMKKTQLNLTGNAGESMVGLMSDQFDRDDSNRSIHPPEGAVTPSPAEQPSVDAPAVPSPAAVPPQPTAAPTPPPVPPVTPYSSTAPQSSVTPPAPSAYPPVPPQPSTPQNNAAPQPGYTPPQSPYAAPQPGYMPPQSPYAAPQPGYTPPQAPVPPQPPVYQPPYASAPGYYAPMQPKKTNGFAVASLACGIAAIPMFCCIWIPILLGVLAIVFGILSRRRDDRMPGIALAGIICGAIGLILAVLFLIGFYNGSMDWLMDDYGDWMYEFDHLAMLLHR